MTQIDLYADGGVIKKNPSEIGGTFAWCHVDRESGVRVKEHGGYITPSHARVPAVTNNLTELIAVVHGLIFLPDNWTGLVYSDSLVTLRRVFKNLPLADKVPQWLVDHMRHIRERIDLSKCDYVLLDGHPTKEQLKTGIGKRGHPVSVHNVWCDDECKRQGVLALKHLESQRNVNAK